MHYCLFVFLGLVFGTAGVCCWGAEGHAIVADVAQSLLTTQTTNAIQKYLNGQLMDQVSSIPDEYDHTPEGKWSEPLHFVNMLRSQTEFDFSTDCSQAPGCVVSAIQNYTKILSNQLRLGTTDGEPNALIFLIHFVGDSHQPLHIGYLDDMGGNDVKCSFFGEYLYRVSYYNKLLTNASDTELHAVWDDSIIERYNADFASFSQELQYIINNNSSIIPFYTQSMNAVDWANESYDFVRSSVYVGVYGTYPKLGEDYYYRNLPIIKERLMAAGIRLGTLVNSIFQ